MDGQAFKPVPVSHRSTRSAPVINRCIQSNPRISVSVSPSLNMHDARRLSGTCLARLVPIEPRGMKLKIG